MDWWTTLPLWIKVTGGIVGWLALACVCAPVLGRFCGLSEEEDQ